MHLSSLQPRGVRCGFLTLRPSLLLLASAALSGCAGSGLAQAQDFSAATPRPVALLQQPYPAPAPTSAVRGRLLPAPGSATRTFTDEAAGYAIDYPAEWFVDYEQGHMVQLMNYDYATVLTPADVPPGWAKIEVVVLKPSEAPDLNTYLQQLRAEGTVLWEESWVLPGGVPAQRLELQSALATKYPLLATAIGDKVIEVAGWGADLSLFDDIARTLRPAGS